MTSTAKLISVMVTMARETDISYTRDAILLRVDKLIDLYIEERSKD
jgi:hypothetical protein